ncbi:MAG TPA: pantoate--beta-alanine ligase [Acetobacteraceae bacterium]|nr:pantoate--beta-alanine ligase [Acetobacteraceae bacterium]
MAVPGNVPSMLIARDLDTLASHRARLASQARSLALVPTMGALHDGHLALIAAARRSGAAVAASIFVNPLQFGPAEDFTSYPRDEAGDLAALAGAGCDLVWLPPLAAMYPADAVTTVDIGGPAERWEGAARPGHFRGVATVVTKLFGQVRPASAYFGEKDWQQVQVVRRLSHDLHLGVEIVPVPTVRAPDGLALSSRNRFLTPAERALAPALHLMLAALADMLAQGGEAEPLLAEAAAKLAASGFLPDYLALVDAETLVPISAARPPGRLIAAARLGAVRLLDNVPVG